MTYCQVRNDGTQEVLAAHVRIARMPWTRLIGFLLTPNASPDQGIFFPHCSAVHMNGMRCGLDIYFLNANYDIVQIIEAAAPYTGPYSCKAASHVLETGIHERQTALIGDRLQFISVADALTS